MLKIIIILGCVSNIYEIIGFGNSKGMPVKRLKLTTTFHGIAQELLESFCFEFQCKKYPMVISQFAVMFYHLFKVAEMDISFDDYCRSTLLNFLERYSSTRKTFGRIKVAKAKMFSPDLFKERSNEENDQLIVEWINTDVFIAGPESEVTSKLQEIQEIIANPSKERYVFACLEN